MPTELWLAAQREVEQLVSIVATDSNYSIQEVTEDYDESTERSPATEKGVVRIRGSIISFIDRLDDEFTRSLQHIDPHGTEYVERLKDEKILYCTICRAQAFYEKTSQSDPLVRVVMRRLEHIYSKVAYFFHSSPLYLTFHVLSRMPLYMRWNLRQRLQMSKQE
jgi:translation initiation factor 3 subunit C